MSASSNRAAELRRDAFSAFDGIVLDVQRLERELYSEKTLCEQLENRVKDLDAEEAKILESTNALYAKREENFKKEVDLQAALDCTEKTLQLEKQRRAGLRHKLERVSQQSDEQKRRLVAKEDKYRAIWDSYRAVYESFPLVVEHDRMMAQVEHENIKLMQANVELKEAHGRIAEMDKITARATRVETVALAEAFCRRSASSRRMDAVRRVVASLENDIVGGNERKQRLLALALANSRQPAHASLPMGQVAALPVASCTGRDTEKMAPSKLVRLLPQVPSMAKVKSRQASLDMVRARYVRSSWPSGCNDGVGYFAQESQPNEAGTPAAPGHQMECTAQDREGASGKAMKQSEMEQFSQAHSRANEVSVRQNDIQSPQGHSGNDVPMDHSGTEYSSHDRSAVNDVTMDYSAGYTSQGHLTSNVPVGHSNGGSSSQVRAMVNDVTMDYSAGYTSQGHLASNVPVGHSNVGTSSQVRAMVNDVTMEHNDSEFPSQGLSTAKPNEVLMDHTEMGCISQSCSSANEVALPPSGLEYASQGRFPTEGLPAQKNKQESCPQGLPRTNEVPMHRNAIDYSFQVRVQTRETPMQQDEMNYFPQSLARSSDVTMLPNVPPQPSIDSGDPELSPGPSDTHFEENNSHNLVGQHLAFGGGAPQNGRDHQPNLPRNTAKKMRKDERDVSGASQPPNWPLNQVLVPRTPPSRPILRQAAETDVLKGEIATRTVGNDPRQKGNVASSLGQALVDGNSEDQGELSCSQHSLTDSSSRLEYLKKLKQSPEFHYAPRFMFKRQAETGAGDDGVSSPYFQPLASEEISHFASAANPRKQSDAISVGNELKNASTNQPEPSNVQDRNPPIAELQAQNVYGHETRGQFHEGEQCQEPLLEDQHDQIQLLPRQLAAGQQIPNEATQGEQSQSTSQPMEQEGQVVACGQYPPAETATTREQHDREAANETMNTAAANAVAQPGELGNRRDLHTTPEHFVDQNRGYLETPGQFMSKNSGYLETPEHFTSQNQDFPLTPGQFTSWKEGFPGQYSQNEYIRQTLGEASEGSGFYQTPAQSEGDFARMEMGGRDSDISRPGFASPEDAMTNSGLPAAPDLHDSSSNESFHYKSPRCSSPPPEPSGFGFMGSEPPQQQPSMFGEPGPAEKRSEAFTFNFSSNSSKPSVFKLF